MIEFSGIDLSTCACQEAGEAGTAQVCQEVLSRDVEGPKPTSTKTCEYSTAPATKDEIKKIGKILFPDPIMIHYLCRCRIQVPPNATNFLVL